MTSRIRILAASVALCGGMLAAQPALADGDVTCGAGPQKGWKKMSAVKKQAWMEGWEILKVQVEGDCYEVYARTEQGQAIEAFFHPETLEKLVVYRRGREIYRKSGFTG